MIGLRWGTKSNMESNGMKWNKRVCLCQAGRQYIPQTRVSCLYFKGRLCSRRRWQFTTPGLASGPARPASHTYLLGAPLRPSVLPGNLRRFHVLKSRLSRLTLIGVCEREEQQTRPERGDSSEPEGGSEYASNSCDGTDETTLSLSAAEQCVVRSRPQSCAELLLCGGSGSRTGLNSFAFTPPAHNIIIIKKNFFPVLQGASYFPPSAAPSASSSCSMIIKEFT